MLAVVFDFFYTIDSMCKLAHLIVKAADNMDVYTSTLQFYHYINFDRFSRSDND